ncbi:MAG TPA: glycosyltransferase [Humisphaera sp.]|nr:glycosyltransferase [Humisphaera sp.]
MSPTPQVSVLMPVAKVRQYLDLAAQSVLCQSFPDLELILIDDDGRADELRTAQRDPRVVVTTSSGKGISDALNTGIAAARGKYICRVDCDDLIPADRIARQQKWLAEHPDFAAICGAMSTMTSDGSPVSDVNARYVTGEITEELRNGIARCSLCTYLLQTDAVRQVGGFRRYFITAEDLDFSFRFGERFRVWYESMPAYWYRLHDSSITHSQRNNTRAFYEKTARDMQMRRRNGGTDDIDAGRPPAPPADGSRPRGSAEAVQHLFTGAAWEKHQAGKKLDALRLGWRACMARPLTLWSWRSLAALAFKRAGAGTNDRPATDKAPNAIR